MLATGTSEKGQFELEGSSTHYPPDMLFSIDKIWLEIEPDFTSRSIKGRQQLKITTRYDLTNLELDSVGLKIESVYYSSGDIALDENRSPNGKKLAFEIRDEKLIIQLNKLFKEGSKFHLLINYNGAPTRGFNFVKSHDSTSKQAWTQGEPAESKYWFPCLDHPQLKYPREISVIVPEDFIVISNGEINTINWNEEAREKKKIKHVWEEIYPNPTYLTCIVIGQFVETGKGENYEGRVPLSYYVPKDRVNDSDRSFRDTIRMMKFFEDYLSTKFPYDKYSQIVVHDFPYGGMENTTCTTLYTDILHDEIAHLDYNSDDVVSHELAHQWFGDFITCRDWQHIWLNEGFATYCEALYVEHVYNTDPREFQHYVLEMINGYIAEAAILYKRPIVTKLYRDLDDLFDAHSYNKGGTIVHMLRHYIGENDFKNSLKLYLDTFGNGTAETDDLRQILEQVSGKNLQLFFDQWVFRKGHPILNIDISPFDRNKLRLKIEQIQEEDVFVFPLEIKIMRSHVERNIERRIEIETIHISEREEEKIFELSETNNIDWISVDPEFKILKEIKSFNAPHNMLFKELEEGETVYEKVQAIHTMEAQGTTDMIPILKNSIKHDFWGVAVESARVLGSIRDGEGASRSALLECLSSATSPKVKRSIVGALGNIQNANDVDLFTKIVQNNNESYFVKFEAAVALGHYPKSISFLESLVETNSFMQIVARGGLRGLLSIIIGSQDKELAKRVMELFISKTRTEFYFRLRQTATSCLGSIGRFREDEREIVFKHLKKLLRDDWVHERNVACIALGNAFQYTQNSEVINELNEVIKNEPDGKVVRTAMESIRMIKEIEEEKATLLAAEKAELKPRSRKVEMLEKIIIQK